MNMVKYYTHGTSFYVFPHYMTLAQLPAALRELEQLAREDMTKKGTQHAVYAVKLYTESGEIDHVDFYDPPVCLNDADFYERTEAEAKEHPGCLIYAVHSHE